MCGIGVIINYGKDKVEDKLTKGLFDNLAARGTDASGLYFEREENGLRIRRLCKAPMRSSDLWRLLQEPTKKEKKQYKLFINKYALNGQEKLIMLHTRNGTRGCESNNHNNGPIFSDNYILVHNGMVTNTKIEGYKYCGEVDSEEILARVETSGVFHGIKALVGSMAIALKPIKSQCVYLYRNSNPIFVEYRTKEQVLVACSMQSYIPCGGLPPAGALASQLFSPGKSGMALPANEIFRFGCDSPSIDVVDDKSEVAQ